MNRQIFPLCGASMSCDHSRLLADDWAGRGVAKASGRPVENSTITDASHLLRAHYEVRLPPLF